MSLVSHHVASLSIVIVDLNKWDRHMLIPIVNDYRMANAFYKAHQVVKTMQLDPITAAIKFNCTLARL